MAKKQGVVKKGEQQLRAETLARRMREDLPKPIVIEFSGLPKAGKSTTLSNVQMFLKRCGFKTEVVVERASVCPIRDKKHANFNAWTACTTLSQILDKTQNPPRSDDPQVLFLDRGLFDAICWFRVMQRLCRIRAEDREEIEKFLLLKEWRSKITGVVLMTATPDDALKREQGLLDFVGTPGSIMNPDVLNQLRRIYDGAAEDMKDKFDIVRIDTSATEFSTPEKSANFALGKILDMIELSLEEKILNIPTSDVDKVFGSSKAVGLEGARRLVSWFTNRGIYNPRRQVESDTTVVQALPVVVVRKGSGDVLILLRREANQRNALHEKAVIWAGGHVREEDGPTSPLEVCAVRELEEELRISLEKDSLKLLGAILDRSNERSARHVAVVYEWRSPSDDVAVALSSDEFFERRGNSLSGEFISLRDLADKVDNGEVMESWSMSIADFLFTAEGVQHRGKLL